MSSLRATLIVGFAVVSAPVPALACVVAMPWNPAEVKQAEVVVMGRLTNHDLVRVRRVRDVSGKAWSVGQAEFDLTVERALVGETPRRIRVKAGKSTLAHFAELPEGRYLVALERPRQHDDGTFTLFQRPCSSAFLMKSGSAKALAVLRVLEGLPPFPPDPPDPPPAQPSAEPAPASTWPAVAGPRPAAEVPAEARLPVVVWIVIGLVGASLAVAFSALVLGRRPRKQDAPPDDDPADLLAVEDE